MLDETTLYERILGLEAPWFVEAVEQDEGKKTISVYVALDESAELCCPKCGNACTRYDTRQRKWRQGDGLREIARLLERGPSPQI